MNLATAEYTSLEVSGALLVAPRSIQYARDLLPLLFCLTSTWAAAYAGFGQLSVLGIGVAMFCGYAVWRLGWCRKNDDSLAQTGPLRISTDGLEWVERSTPLVLMAVIRHWAGVTLVCQSQSNPRALPQRLTLWRNGFVAEDYRRLGIILNWLTRGKT